MATTFTPDNVTMLEAKSGAIPYEQGQTIVGDVMDNSVYMSLARYEEMTAPQKTFSVLTDGLSAYWVGEGEKIQTSKPTLIDVTMTAKKLGVIVLVSREKLAYKVPEFFESVRPLVSEAFYKKIDAAAILGKENPFVFSVDKSATDAVSVVKGGLDSANFDTALNHLYDNGVEPNAVISTVSNTSLLRQITRKSNGVDLQIYDQTSKTLDGTPVFNLHKEVGLEKGSLYLGDFDNAFYGIPYNMNYLVSEDATISTITDESGESINLYERELAALRITMDIAIMITKDKAFSKITTESV
jgi:HK97 family phage major capsid protein